MAEKKNEDKIIYLLVLHKNCIVFKSVELFYNFIEQFEHSELYFYWLQYFLYFI